MMPGFLYKWFISEFFPRNQWGHRGSRTGKWMKLSLVWYRGSLGEGNCSLLPQAALEHKLCLKHTPIQCSGAGLSYSHWLLSLSLQLMTIHCLWALVWGPPKSQVPTRSQRTPKPGKRQLEIMLNCSAFALLAPASHQESDEEKEPVLVLRRNLIFLKFNFYFILGYIWVTILC